MNYRSRELEVPKPYKYNMPENFTLTNTQWKVSHEIHNNFIISINREMIKYFKRTHLMELNANYRQQPIPESAPLSTTFSSKALRAHSAAIRKPKK